MNGIDNVEWRVLLKVTGQVDRLTGEVLLFVEEDAVEN